MLSQPKNGSDENSWSEPFLGMGDPQRSWTGRVCLSGWRSGVTFNWNFVGRLQCLRNPLLRFCSRVSPCCWQSSHFSLCLRCDSRALPEGWRDCQQMTSSALMTKLTSSWPTRTHEADREPYCFHLVPRIQQARRHPQQKKLGSRNSNPLLESRFCWW